MATDDSARWMSKKREMFVVLALSLFVTAWVTGCGHSESEPADIESGDKCAFCRMEISQPGFASEIIYEGKVYKFDDLACLSAFKTRRGDKIHGTTYLIDYATKRWIRSDEATIVVTGVATPRGSGLLAFADTARANAFSRAHPPRKAM